MGVLLSSSSLLYSVIYVNIIQYGRLSAFYGILFDKLGGFKSLFIG